MHGEATYVSWSGASVLVTCDFEDVKPMAVRPC
jgi:hypothetical protein